MNHILPIISDTFLSLPSGGQCLTAKRISLTYLSSSLRYNYFRFEKNKRPPYWNSTSGFDFGYITAIGLPSCIRLMNFVQIGALTAEIWRHIHFSRWRPRPLNTTSGFVFVVQQAHQISFTYLHSRLRYNYFRFWKTNAILEFYFWFWSWPFHRYSASGCPNRTMNCGNMTSCRFSRWRPSAMFCLLWGNGRPPTKFFLWSELGPEIACSSD